MSDPANATPSASTPSAAPPSAHKGPPPPPPRGSTRVLHRVCIQCNNMFRVTPENFDSKQCSNCFKG